MPEKMRAVSLFSGALAGGFEIGFDRAGIETVLQCEIDPVAQSVLRRHWPDTERVSDVRDVGVGVLREPASRGGADGTPTHVRRRQAGTGISSSIDLVYGGFPCQDLSVAGKRAGLGGDRSGLWFEFHRVLRELRPRWAIIENVPGLLSSNGGLDFAIVLNGLEELGFWWAYGVLDAQHFGIPQRRRRVFIVAGPSRRACEQVLSLCESCGGNPETGGTPGQDLASSLSVGTLRAGGATAGNNPGITNAVLANPLGAHHHRHDLDNEPYVPDIVGALSDGAHHGGGLNGQDAYSGRIFAPTSGVRRLTPLECERLMGWPDDWTRYDDKGREISGSRRYRLCGNGVVATVAEWIGHRLVAVDVMMQRAEAVA